MLKSVIIKLRRTAKKNQLLRNTWFFGRNVILSTKTIIPNFLYYLYNHLITHIPSHVVRRFYLKNIMGIKIGRKTFVHMGCIFYSNVKIGNNSVIGRQCHLLGDITIGDNVSITAQTYIFSASHDKDSPSFESYDRKVVIEDYVWVGARAMILPGVRLGKGSILGAASTATKNIPSYEVWVGSPAKKVNIRSKNLEYELNYFPYFQ